MTHEQMAAEITRLQAENTRLSTQSQTAGKITLKVSTKGGLSAYGLGRWPVTLYREQWLRLLAQADAIKAFIAKNSAALATKGDIKAPALPSLVSKELQEEAAMLESLEAEQAAALAAAGK